MRRLVPVLALVASTAVSCAMPQGFEITTPMVAPGEPLPTAVLSGAAVDQGILCSEATVETIRWEDRDGKEVAAEEAQRLTDEARDTGTITLDVWYDEYTCTDGSGSFILEVFPELSPSDYDLDGSSEIGRFDVGDGTGDYDPIFGDGHVTLDFARSVQICNGNVTKQSGGLF